MKNLIVIFIILSIPIYSCKIELKVSKHKLSKGVAEDISLKTDTINEQAIYISEVFDSVVYNIDNDNISKTAINSLAPESALEHVAYFDNNEEVRKLAVSKLSNESALRHVAYFDNNSEVKKLAIKMLVKQKQSKTE